MNSEENVGIGGEEVQPETGRLIRATHVAPADLAPERLDVYVARAINEVASRSAARKAIKRGDVLLDGAPAEPQWRVRPDQRIDLLQPRKAPPPYHLELAVFFEDDCLAVVGKPPGVPVSGNCARTVERALYGNLRPSTVDDALPWPRPVHRLDVPTGGLLLVAKSASVAVDLGRQFQARDVSKRYRAIVVGKLDGQGCIREPVDGRAAESRFTATIHSRSLRTDWLTTVDLYPSTGRTHQLRRHMAETGHPIVGDTLYGPTGQVFRGKGLFLWAVRLAFRHPRTGDPVDITIDEPPKFLAYREREEKRWLRHHG